MSAEDLLLAGTRNTSGQHAHTDNNAAKYFVTLAVRPASTSKRRAIPRDGI
jgi:hypothetical protein